MKHGRRVKRFLMDQLRQAGEQGIRLDSLIDKANRQFMNVHVTGEFIISFLQKRRDVDHFLVRRNKQHHHAFKLARPPERNRACPASREHH